MKRDEGDEWQEGGLIYVTCICDCIVPITYRALPIPKLEVHWFILITLG